MATIRKLTWEKKEKRWKKVYKGRVWHSARGMQKTDTQAYQTTVEEFQRWRAEIDLQTEASKPYRAEYEQAIKLRQAMMDWLRLEGLETRTPEERAEYDRLGKWPFTTNPPKVVLRPPAIFVTTGAWRDGSPNRKLPS